MLPNTPGWPDLDLLEKAPILVWRAGTDGLCDWFNSAWLAYRGRSLEQERGNGWAEGVHPDDFARCLDTYRAAFAARRTFDMEYRLARADGGWGWIVDYGVPVHARDGEFLGYVGYCFEATAQRLAEERMRAKEAELEQACRELASSNAELEQFAYIASHDLREPLRMIGSYAGLLDKRYGSGLDETAREFLGYILDGARRLDGLVSGLLAYARIDRQDEAHTPLSPAQVAGAALRNLEVAMNEAEATCGNGLGDAPSVLGAPNQLVSLFQNIIGNGIKYRHPGTNPHVRLSWRELGDRLEISVADNGIGIPPEARERVFGLFQRLHTRKAYEGNGIGLAVARKIVERHGGSIWVDSEAGAGCVFRFTLPRA